MCIYDKPYNHIITQNLTTVKCEFMQITHTFGYAILNIFIANCKEVQYNTNIIIFSVFSLKIPG